MKVFGIIILIVLFLGITSGILYLYFKVERPQQEAELILVDVNILAEKDNKLITTGYRLYLNDTLFIEGNTSDRAATNIKVRSNNTIRVESFNIGNQTYYKDTEYSQSYTTEPKRITLDILEVGNLNINKKGNFPYETYMYLIINPEKYFKNATVCLDWSEHILLAENPVLQRNYELEDKCYYFKSMEANTTYYFDINYVTFGDVNTNDFINIAFYDHDVNYTKRQVYTIQKNN